MTGPEIERLIQLLSKLPGLGSRSAKRAVLHLLKRRETLLEPLAEAMIAASKAVSTCEICGNLDSRNPCSICSDPARDSSLVCVVEEVGDLWALERSRTYRGVYHVMGGALSALAGVGPQDLTISGLLARIHQGTIKEAILALSATVEGQTTAHYVTDRLIDTGITLTRLAHGLPMGGELHYLDDGTLMTALKARQVV